jgi:hypothetical protein
MQRAGAELGNNEMLAEHFMTMSATSFQSPLITKEDDSTIEHGSMYVYCLWYPPYFAGF